MVGERVTTDQVRSSVVLGAAALSESVDLLLAQVLEDFGRVVGDSVCARFAADGFVAVLEGN